MPSSAPSPVLRRIRLIASALILVAALALGLQAIFKSPAGRSGGGAAIGGAFTLTDSHGRTVTEKDFLGKPMLVYFGYTYCPDVCPFTLQLMAQALDRLGPDKARIQPVFISVDPERDTPQTLAQYIHSPGFPDNLEGLTGTPEQIADIAHKYAVYYKKAGEGDAYLVDHTSAIFLMDAQGKYAAVFTHNSSVDDIARCLRRHLDGKKC